jgi:hypothetical protein
MHAVLMFPVTHLFKDYVQQASISIVSVLYWVSFIDTRLLKEEVSMNGGLECVGKLQSLLAKTCYRS